MAIIKKKKNNLNVTSKIEIKKICLLIVVVNRGQGMPIIKLLEKYGIATSLILKGEGTAEPNLYDLLGLSEKSKDVVLTTIREDLINDIKDELNLYFLSSKKNKGVASIVDLSSIVNGLAYRFLTNQY